MSPSCLTPPLLFEFNLAATVQSTRIQLSRDCSIDPSLPTYRFLTRQLLNTLSVAQQPRLSDTGSQHKTPPARICSLVRHNPPYHASHFNKHRPEIQSRHRPHGSCRCRGHVAPVQSPSPRRYP
ncbi:unnamed protein product [Chondrus crispus]|uniref:Uncharacterized protein n=1 Tax=Chondrus crispus TaxID=2769 RepID=R7Q6Q5_CHOCR|nr:unnamed protein product [Chondrus crispus]CDF33483.1 unnamed protein product [Chondrus crispus]|eukprot:XP_005713286.1 unnamed protein product [Chondrus crispus]